MPQTVQSEILSAAWAKKHWRGGLESHPPGHTRSCKGEGGAGHRVSRVQGSVGGVGHGRQHGRSGKQCWRFGHGVSRVRLSETHTNRNSNPHHPSLGGIPGTR